MAGLGVALALVSAGVWGAGDFCGGRASKRAHQFQVLAVAAASGIVLLAFSAVLTREPLPTPLALAWAAAAGLAGALGISALYRGLAIGSAATVAPTAAVVTAVLPVLVSAVTAGLPDSTQLVGFAVAAAGIWLVAGGLPGAAAAAAGVRLALLAGIGFGAFLVLIAQVPATMVFIPLAVARCLMLLTAFVLMFTAGQKIPSPLAHPVALLAGILDAGGNVFYMLAREHTRLDVAAVLSSLYPVATVALARLVVHEPVSGRQWIGAGVCLAAVVLIAI